MEHPAPLDALPEAARKVLGGPAPLKMMAARGMAPLPPVALLSVLYVLSHEADEKLATAARATLDKLPAPLLDGALASPELPAPVLDLLAARALGRPELAARVAQHPAVAPETVVQLARGADEALCELIATNEQRLLTSPAIIEALYMNTALRMSTADRIVELAARNGVALDIPAFKDIAASLSNELIPEAGEETPADEAFREAIAEARELEAEQRGEGEGEPEDVVERDEDGNEAVKEKFQKVEKRLQDMKMSELLRVATLGTAPQRLILVRSRNRVIAMAAINSPKMLASDAERVAESAAVSEDVLRSIAGRRDWLGQRPMIRAKLCRNPKTPLHASIAQLPFLRDADLKALARSKNVPQALKSAVNQLVAKRAPKT